MSNANPKLSLAEAEKVIEQAYPKQGVTIQIPNGPSGCYKIVRANGEVIVSSFNLLQACRSAVEPLFAAEKKKRAEAIEVNVQDFKDFIAFLREKHADEFDKWREYRNAEADSGPEAGDPVRPQPDPPRLVSVVSE